MSQAMKSFVSFVRAYSKHEASYIFRIKDLDLIGVAKSFGLLRLPRMPELKDLDKTEWKDASLDVSAFDFRPGDVYAILTGGIVEPVRLCG